MSRERKFHTMVEELDREEKNRVWSKIKKQEERLESSSGRVTFEVPNRKTFLFRKVILASISSIVVLAGVIFATINFLPNNMGNGNIQVDNSGNSEAENENRYCSTDMYGMVETELTLKERVELEKKNFLYLDWYESTDYCTKSIYQIYETQELIGYKEEIVDINTGSLVGIHIIVEGYQLESLDVFEKAYEVVNIDGVEIVWRIIENISYAKFEYGGYIYCITLEYPMEEDSILEVVQELLN